LASWPASTTSSPLARKKERPDQVIDQEELNEKKLDAEEDVLSRTEPLKIMLTQHIGTPI
jgi:hypothetical protein